jgi:hypothetical protein
MSLSSALLRGNSALSDLKTVIKRSRHPLLSLSYTPQTATLACLCKLIQCRPRFGGDFPPLKPLLLHNCLRDQKSGDALD